MTNTTANVSKINLEIVNRMVKELQLALEVVAKIEKDTPLNTIDYIVALNKAVGIASGIVQEGSLLMADISVLSRKASSGSAKSPEDEMLKNIFSMIKPGTN